MSQYFNPEALVTTEWVADHLGDPNVKLVEVDVDTSAYESGHIPGAVAFNWTRELSDAVTRDILSKAALERLLGQAGIGNEDVIVLYGDNNNWFAAFAYWLLKIYGHGPVKLMNGGRKKWELEGRPLTTEVPNPQPTMYRASEPDFSIRARQVDVLQLLGDERAALIDVRSPAEFTGQVVAPPGMTETAQRAGHIPGAANVPWAKAVNDDGTFKSREELAAIYEAAGATPDRDVVAYCRIGERSSHTWFVLKELLGYPKVRNYDGSWTEWGSMVGVPIENPSLQGGRQVG